MVYFGPRKYRPSQRGLNRGEKMRVIGPILLLLTLFAIVVVPRLGEEQRPSQITGVLPVNESEGVSSNNTGSQLATPGSDVPEPVAITPADMVFTDPEPFVELPAILASVRDEAAVDPGPMEKAGLIYLLHRWRAGFPVSGVREAPRVSEIAEQAKQIRGSRMRAVLTLIENPQPRNIEENASGVTRIWEVFGSDSDGHLHRVDFIRKPKNLPRGADVVLEGDFLRLYRYQTLAGQEAMVPQWVADTLELYQSPFVTEGDPFFPLWIIGGLSLVTLALLLMIQSGHRRPVSRKRRRT